MIEHRNHYRATRKRIIEELQGGILFPGFEEYFPFFHGSEIPIQHAKQIILIEPERDLPRVIKISHLIEHRFDGLETLDRPLIHIR